MRLTLDHDLGRDALRARIVARLAREAARPEGYAPAAFGGATVATLRWVDDYQLATEASAMGFTVPCLITIDETALVFDVDVPVMLGFARGMIEALVRDKGAKLLA